MSSPNRAYVTKSSTRLKPPDFTLGLSSLVLATGVLMAAVPAEAGTPAILILPWDNNPFNKMRSHETDRVRVRCIIDKTPRFIPDAKTQTAASKPFKYYASLISTALGLGKSDIARILGVSRPTLYSWIKGTSEPKENDHPERLRTLGEWMDDICRESSRPLYHRFVEAPMPGRTDSILSLLQTERWDKERLRELLAEARRLTMERDRHLGNDVPVAVALTRQKNNLLDNSMALNLE